MTLVMLRMRRKERMEKRMRAGLMQLKVKTTVKAGDV